MQIKKVANWFEEMVYKKTDSPVDIDKSPDFLVNIADIDYLTARLLIHTGFVYPILFHSHQAIEKYLKVVLMQEKIPYPNIHSLKKLINKVRNSKLFTKDEIKKLKEKCNLIDKQYETSRYGGEARYNFFVNIVRLFVIENQKERKATKKDGFRVAGMIMFPPNYIETLDEIIAIIRPKINKNVNHLKEIIDDKDGFLSQGWKLSVTDDESKKILPINIKSILLPKNNYIEELKK